MLANTVDSSRTDQCNFGNLFCFHPHICVLVGGGGHSCLFPYLLEAVVNTLCLRTYPAGMSWILKQTYICEIFQTYNHPVSFLQCNNVVVAECRFSFSSFTKFQIFNPGDWLLYNSSILEEEEERGVAHIVEHLAFSATRQYTNHDIVRFLESIGAEFGACQNASTSPDETIYELLVPIDKPDILSQALNILAEFSTEVSIKLRTPEVYGRNLPMEKCIQGSKWTCFK